MPRFYFDITDGGSDNRDPEGVVVDSLDVAEREASALAIARIAESHLSQNGEQEVQVLVSNEGRTPVACVSLILSRTRI
jgi:hypothetical protein